METVAAAIVAALTAGAAGGISEVAKKAVSDGYSGLKALIDKKFGGHGDVTAAIKNLQAKPESPGRQQTLTEELKATNAFADQELLSAAQSLLELIKALPQESQNVQNIVGNFNAQARGGTASVSVVAPPPPKKKSD